MKEIVTRYKNLLFPILVVVGLVIMSFAVGSFLIGRVGSVRAEIKAVDTENEVLASRLETLRSLDPNLAATVNFVSIAVPERNPSVLVTRQLRTLATKWTISLSNLSITTQMADASSESETAPLNMHEIGFEASGTYQNLFDFVANLSEIVPLVNLSSLSLRTPVGENFSAQIRLFAQSAPFPRELPALDEALVGLTESEQEALDAIESYAAPVIDTAPQATGSSGPIRVNPYAPL